ncbi:MAG: RNA polymerase sigma factor SigZ [Caldilineae bacterium]|nr:MAG: RNA polymerase sigma factor SigZ [Caldilineae bacterium]
MTLSTEQIWERCHEEIYAFILRRVKDPVDADDILQETFLKIHRHLSALRDDERLAAWIYQIARNAIADHYRRRRPLEKLPDDVADRLSTQAEPPSNGVEEVVVSWLKPMVMTLPPRYREALLLSEFEGLSQKEVAARLGLSYSGAKSRVQRGRALLKEKLLACCAFEFDRRGGIIGYEPLPAKAQQDPCEGHCRTRQQAAAASLAPAPASMEIEDARRLDLARHPNRKEKSL